MNHISARNITASLSSSCPFQGARTPPPPDTVQFLPILPHSGKESAFMITGVHSLIAIKDVRFISIGHRHAWLPRWYSGKESACQRRGRQRWGSILGWGRSLGKGNGNPLQYSCLGNPTDRRAWQAMVPGVPRVRLNWATRHKHTHAHTDVFGNGWWVASRFHCFSFMEWILGYGDSVYGEE